MASDNSPVFELLQLMNVYVSVATKQPKCGALFILHLISTDASTPTNRELFEVWCNAGDTYHEKEAAITAHLMASLHQPPGVSSYESNRLELVIKQASGDLSHLAVCPFNRAHMVKKSRLQYHLVKCAKNYKGTKVPCPYNHTEYFEPEDLISHLSLCTSRKSVEVQQYCSEKNRNDTILLKKKLPSTPVQEDNRHSDENWGFD